MPDYNFEHKCRRCGTIIDTGSTSTDNIYQLRSLLYDILTKQTEDDPVFPPVLSLHSCEDGGVGVTDLIGCKEAKV